MDLQPPLKIAIIGATGRLGKAIGIAALKDSSFQITGAITQPKSPHLDLDFGTFLSLKPLGIPISSSPKAADLFIDASSSAAFSQNLEVALLHQKPLVIGVTGLKEEDLLLLKDASQEIPIFYSANFSVGMALLQKAAFWIASHFYEEATIDLIETHHSQKKDAPSGSALMLIKTIQKARPSPTTPKIHSIRSGQVVGEHELLFNTPEEKLTISHVAHSRDAFARGALSAAKFLFNKPPGLYGMENLLRHLDIE